MKTTRISLLLMALAIFMLSFTACLSESSSGSDNDEDDEEAECDDGDTKDCECEDGSEGTRTCDDGEWSKCSGCAEEIECPEGLYWDGRGCVPYPDGDTDPECAKGYHWNGEKCVSDESSDGDENHDCEDGYYWNGQECVEESSEDGDSDADSEPECADGYHWNGEECVSDECIPDCDDKECGSDGCDGSCGECEYGECIEGSCVLPNATHFENTSDKWRVPQGGWLDGGFNKLYGTTPGGDYNYDWEEWTTIDIDGDGRLDLVVTAKTESKDGYYYWKRVLEDNDGAYWKVFFNTGNGFNPVPQRWRVPQGGWVDGGFNTLSGTTPGGENYYGWEEWTTVDINGDRKPDLVVTAKTESKDGYYYWKRVLEDNDGAYWKVFINTGTSFNPIPQRWRVPQGGWQDGGFNALYGTTPGADYYYDWEEWTTTDINGDSLPDLIVTAKTESKDGYYFWKRVLEDNDGAYWKVFINTGTSFNPVGQKWRVPQGGWQDGGFNALYGTTPGSNHYYDWEEWSTLDINGDNMLDLVVTAKTESKDGYYYWERVLEDNDGAYWKIFLNTGTSFNPVGQKWRVPQGGWQDGGFNKLYGTTPGSSHYYDWEEWTTTDLNGDRLPDLIVTAKTESKDGYYYWKRVLEDNDGAYWKIFLNTGTSFNPVGQRWRVPQGGWQDGGFNALYGTTPGSNHYYDWEEWTTTDLNGDGIMDLIVTATTKAKEGYYYWERVLEDNEGAYWKVFFGAE